MYFSEISKDLKEEILERIADSVESRAEMVIKLAQEYNVRIVDIAYVSGVGISTIQHEILNYLSTLNDTKRSSLINTIRVYDAGLTFLSEEDHRFSGEDLNLMFIGLSRLDVLNITSLKQSTITKRLLEYAKAQENTKEIIQDYVSRKLTVYFELAPEVSRSSYNDSILRNIYRITDGELKIIREIASYLDHETEDRPAKCCRTAHAKRTNYSVQKNPIKY